MAPDLFSDLPKNVTHDIMECLPLQAAAKMSALSTKWRETWLTLPCLVLDVHFFRYVLGSKRHYQLEFSSLVSKLLLQHNGPVAKFTLYIPRLEHEPDINQWLSFLSGNGIKELMLENHNKAPLNLPFSLYSCTYLTKLKLTYFILRPPQCFKGFWWLLSLELENIAFERGNIGSFIAECPLLENLTFRNWSGFQKLSIKAPYLKYLTISGIFQSICLSGSLNLLSVSITLMESMNNCSHAETQQLIKFLSDSCKVEKLCFGRYFVKFLAAGGIADMLPVTFTHVKHLQLPKIDSSTGFCCIAIIIQCCPNVEYLNITATGIDDGLAEHNLGYDVSSKFLQLRNIDLKLNRVSVAELKLIEFLLACSPVLETFTLYISDELDTDLKSRLSSQLKRFHKASPKIFFMMEYMICKDDDQFSDYDEKVYSGSDSDSDSFDDEEEDDEETDYSTSDDD